MRKIKLMYFVILVKNNLLEIENTFSLSLLLTDKLNEANESDTLI